MAPFAPSVIDRLGDLSRCEGHFAWYAGFPFQLPDRFARKSLTTSLKVTPSSIPGSDRTTHTFE